VSRNPSRKGSLTIVGTGIEAVVQITPEARSCIERADKLLYVQADPVSSHWIQTLNPRAESLGRLYGTKKRRKLTYLETVDQILHFVRKGLNVCVAFYGHPAVFCFPGHEAMRRARAAGFPARMLPAISSLDCLFADVGIDPGRQGCQSFEASDFLLHSRKFDSTSPLILLQAAVIGESALPLRPCNRAGLKILTNELRKHYPANHQVVIYEASQFVVSKPHIVKVLLSALPRARLTPMSTLYIPPRARPAANRRMLRLLSRLCAEGSVSPLPTGLDDGTPRASDRLALLLSGGARRSGGKRRRRSRSLN
jgi:precorrin-6B methylase 1